MIKATLKQRACKSKQLNLIDVEKKVQKMRDEEERRKWRLKRPTEKNNKHIKNDPPLGLGKL